MRRIFKYTIAITDTQMISVPMYSDILTVQMQRGEVCVWVKVNPIEEKSERVVIYIHGTGNPIPEDENSAYLGTIQEMDGDLVWHVFYRYEAP